MQRRNRPDATLRGAHLSGYVERYGAPPAPASSRCPPPRTLGGLRTIDAHARARHERECFNTGFLAVLVCWVLFLGPIFTLVAGISRWLESRRAYGANHGAFATIFSAAALAVHFAFVLAQ